MAYGISNTQIQSPDIVGGYSAGLKSGQQQARRPILDQLDKLKVRQSEQAIKSGEKRLSLQDHALKEAERKQQSEKMSDIGNAAQWVSNQPDQEGAWNQALDYYASQGEDVEMFRGRSDLIPMVSALSNPDYAKQQAAQQNLQVMLQTLPQDKRAGFAALQSSNPNAAAKAYGENLFAADTSGQLESLVSPLPQKQQEQVSAVYSADPDAAVKLASDLIKQQSKPKKDKTGGEKKATGFLRRMENAEATAAGVLGEGYDPSSVDRFATGGTFTNFLATKEGQRYWNAASEWTRAKLRHESGAAIGIDEAKEEARTYFPVAGDDQKTIQQKKELRNIAMLSMGEQSGVEPKGVEVPKGLKDLGDGTFEMADGTIIRRTK